MTTISRLMTTISRHADAINDQKRVMLALVREISGVWNELHLLRQDMHRFTDPEQPLVQRKELECTEKLFCRRQEAANDRLVKQIHRLNQMLNLE
jgi:hypothetical protein